MGFYKINWRNPLDNICWDLGFCKENRVFLKELIRNKFSNVDAYSLQYQSQENLYKLFGKEYKNYHPTDSFSKTITQSESDLQEIHNCQTTIS